MPNRRLRAVSRTQGNNRAIKDGTIRLPHYELDFEEVPVLPQAFRRMVRNLEFDVCEMALTTYLVAKRYGKPFTALPIFLVRGFHHGAIQVRDKSDNARITGPKDLEGRAVGVNRGYTVTTGVWARGILREDYGVDLDKVTWVLSGDEHVTEYQPPPNVVPNGNLSEDVLIGAEAEGLQPLLEEDGYGWLTTKGWYPINHCIVVKDDVLTDELANELLDAFTEAKNQYIKGFGNTPTDRMYQKVHEITGQDPLPYGLEPNRDALETLVEHAIDQHILDERPNLDDIFIGGPR